MAPKVKVTKGQILTAAVNIVRRDGIGALNARDLAKRLNCSTQPIFSCYSTMEKLKTDVMEEAIKCYQQYLETGMKNPGFPPYKAAGMSYIRFAKEEKELFRLLFMRDRTGERIDEITEETDCMARLISSATGLSYDQALQMHILMWIYVHGIATMVVTSYLDWDWETISSMMTDVYEGVKQRYLNKEKR